MGGLTSTEGLSPSKKFSAPGPAAPPTTNGAAQDGPSATQLANGTLSSSSANVQDASQEEAEKQVKVAAIETHTSNDTEISSSDAAGAPGNNSIKPAASTPIPAGV